jgi:hypothetical protein
VREYPTEEVRARVRERLTDHARGRWGLAGVDVKFRGAVAHVEGRLHGGAYFRLCLLRFRGDPDVWGFEVNHFEHGGHEEVTLPDGALVGSPEQVFDLACELNFTDPDDD